LLDTIDFTLDPILHQEECNRKASPKVLYGLRPSKTPHSSAFNVFFPKLQVARDTQLFAALKTMYIEKLDESLRYQYTFLHPLGKVHPMRAKSINPRTM
jgi:hypothetical protein